MVADDTPMTTTNTRAAWLLAAVAFGIAPCVPAAPAQPAFAQLLEQADRADLAPLRRADLSRYAPAEQLLLQARLAVARGDVAAASALLERYEKLNDKDPARRREALARRQDIDLLSADYAGAASHGEAWERTK